MQTILHNCCGLDVHKDSIVACILKTSNLSVENASKEEVEKEIRVFDTFPDELMKLRKWLESENCRHVAMESTGVYWHPVYVALEDCFDGEIEILVCNARHMKNVPGKKTDIKDAEWIAKLLRAGLLNGSFIPPEQVRQLRKLTRYRKTVVEDICTQKNRIEKTLQMDGFKLSSFLSDVFGVSGRNLMEVIIDKGHLTPEDVDTVAKHIKEIKRNELKRAINGKLNPQQREFLKLQICHLDELLEHLRKIEESISTLSVQFDDAINRIVTIPGIATTAATAIIAEIGTDMDKFPTANHFTSWAGVTPGDNVSAGKKKTLE